MMTSLLFEIGGDVGGQIEITEIFDPISSRTQLHFTVTLASDTDLVGDLRAIFLALFGLIVEGPTNRWRWPGSAEV
jgi:hypothetical protein